MDSRI